MLIDFLFEAINYGKTDPYFNFSTLLSSLDLTYAFEVTGSGIDYTYTGFTYCISLELTFIVGFYIYNCSFCL